MIELMMLLAYLVPTFFTFRRAGFLIEQRMLRGHSYQSICKICNGNCKHCNQRAEYHGSRRYDFMGSCDNFEPGASPVFGHYSSLFGGLALGALWPVLLPGFFGYAIYTKAGGQFELFKPPPRIETKAQKNERKLAEAQAEIEETNKRLEELGIDL